MGIERLHGCWVPRGDDLPLADGLFFFGVFSSEWSAGAWEVMSSLRVSYEKAIEVMSDEVEAVKRAREG